MKTQPNPGPDTIIMHHAEERLRLHGAAAPPLFQNSTFTFPHCEEFATRSSAMRGVMGGAGQRFDYTRVSNPTTSILEQKIALLEKAEAARAFGSGMAAISAAVLSCVKAGDHIVTIEMVYGPTRTFFTSYLPRFGIETTFVRGTEIDQFKKALRPNTKLLYIESPSSLTFDLQDLAAVAELAKSRHIATAIDNSYCTPYFQNPIPMGIDLVCHTATKYIGGHSDVVAGLVVGSNARLSALARAEGELLGAVCDPFAAWLMLRGLRTLPVRLDRHRDSALTIARWLENDKRVKKVHHPGLPSHPQHELGLRQMRGTCGLVSFELSDPSRERAFAVVDALKYFCIAVSWGGYESLAIPIEVPDFERGGRKWIIRLSIGLENVTDLQADLDAAMGIGAVSASRACEPAVTA